MKLSNTKKEQIVKRVISHKFDSKEKELQVRANIIVNELVRKELETFNFKGLDKFLKFTDHAYIGDAKDTYDSSVWFCVDLTERVPTKYLNDWKKDYFYQAESKEEKKLLKDKVKLQNQITEAKENIKAVVNSCNTDKQLLKTLPEISELIKDIINTSMETQLVAVETVEKVKLLLQ